MPRRFDHRRVVGELRAVVGAVCFAQQSRAENLRRLDDAQAAAVDGVRDGAVRLAVRIGRLDNRNGGAVLGGRGGRAADELGRSEGPHPVLHGDQPDVVRERRETVADGEKPLLSALGDGVGRHVETRAQVVPKLDMGGRKHHDDGSSRQRLGEAAYRAGQHGLTAEQRELLGDAAAETCSGTSRHDDDPDPLHGAISWALRPLRRAVQAAREPE